MINNSTTTIKKLYIELLLTSLLWLFVACLEENHPAILLQPRNFNPHPSEIAAYQRRNNHGPVVFPPNPEDDENSVSSNIVTLRRQNEQKSNHPIDNHPYSRVANKRKNQLPGRFRDAINDDRINPKVYEALSNHAVKVLSQPPSQLGKDYILSSLSEQQKNYEFSYKVIDHLTGDDFSHRQAQNLRTTNGEYRVKLPDGRIQIVSYIADKNGYKADVKYMEDYNIDQERVTYAPVHYDNYEDTVKIYHKNVRPTPSPVIVTAIPAGYIAVTPTPAVYTTDNLVTPLPRIYDKGRYVTPNPVPYLRQTSRHYDTQPKVEIYTNNNELTRLGNYIESTPIPYLLQGLSSTSPPHLEDYDELYASSTPKYQLINGK